MPQHTFDIRLVIPLTLHLYLSSTDSSIIVVSIQILFCWSKMSASMAVPKPKQKSEPRETETYYQHHVEALQWEVCELSKSVATVAVMAKYYNEQLYAHTAKMKAKLDKECIFIKCVPFSPLRHTRLHVICPNSQLSFTAHCAPSEAIVLGLKHWSWTID